MTEIYLRTVQKPGGLRVRVLMARLWVGRSFLVCVLTPHCVLGVACP